MSSTSTERPPTILDEMMDHAARQRLLSRQFGQYRHSEFRILHMDCAPKTDHCPRCKVECRRVAADYRGLIDASLNCPVLLWVRVGDYECISRSCVRRARRRGRKKSYFRTNLPFATPRSRFTNQAKRYGLDSICLDGLSTVSALRHLARVFYVQPSLSTLWRWQQGEGALAKEAFQYQQFVTEELSGVVCIDEMYEGEMAMIVCRDPLRDQTLGFMVVEGSVDAEKTEKFLRYLDAIGVRPDVAITDDSPLYPETLKRVWPQIRQQLCIFHVVKNIFKDAMKAVRAYQKTLPKNPKRRRGPPCKRGRPRIDHSPRNQQVQKGRYLLFTRPEKLSQESSARLEVLLNDHPTLTVVRSFALDIFQLFKPDQTPEEARSRCGLILATPAYIANPQLQKAMQYLQNAGKFAKMIAFLDYENLERTNNNVERHNRGTRKQQNGRYKLRTPKTLELQQWIRLGHEAAQTRAAVKLTPRKTKDDAA